MWKLLCVALLCCCGLVTTETGDGSDGAAPAECVMELRCAECVPDNMPLVTSHRADAAGVVRAAHGEQLTLSCGAGQFAAYPRRVRAPLTVTCHGGRYSVPHDPTSRHLLELGCQENVFEDTLHAVEYCGAPLQGRAYQVRDVTRETRHLATVCYDQDRALAVRARASSPATRMSLPPHEERTAPLTLLGNFNHMFDATTRHDAERLYSNDERLNRRVRELLRHERVSFAAQSLTAGALLSPLYFDDQSARVADFASNKIAVWRSVAEGNLRNLQHDVARLLQHPRAVLDVHAGTSGTLALRTGHARTELYLKPGRFPVPRYVWTVLHAPSSGTALALVLLNDPFVAVSEIREAVFCESVCGRVPWLRDLRRNRNYETPVEGLVFCCEVHNFTSVVSEMPADIVKDVPAGSAGLLMDAF